MFGLGELNNRRLDFGVLDLVERESWELVENVEDLENDVVVVFPHVQGGTQDLVAVHLDHPIANAVIVALLNAAQELDRNPLLLALHERSHDLADPALVQASGLDIVDVLFVVLARLLLSGLLRDGQVPSVAVLDTERFDGGMRQLGGALRLRLASDEAGAIRLAAVAGLRIGTVSVHVVVEDQLLASFDAPLGKDTHAQLLADNPFVHVAVGIAGVIAEAAEIALLGRIDELVLREGHEVEMLDAFLVILYRALPKGRLVDDLADVLEDKVVGFQVNIGPEPEALFFGLNDRDVGVLPLLKSLVLAPGTAVAFPAHALHLGRAIDAVGIFATRMILAIP